MQQTKLQMLDRMIALLGNTRQHLMNNSDMTLEEIAFVLGDAYGCFQADCPKEKWDVIEQAHDDAYFGQLRQSMEDDNG